MVDKIPAGPGWVHQIKWDGVRILTYFDGKEIKLFNRNQNERTQNYPELTDVKSYVSAQSVILDGEVIALGADGKPSFHEIMRRDGIRRYERVKAMMQTVHIFYMIYDVIYFNGEWINSEMLEARMDLLSKIIRTNDTIQILSAQTDGVALFNTVRQQNMEGIVSKRLDSSYILSGKDDRWQKVKNYKDLIAVVGGATYRQGKVNAILLGLYNEQNQLIYVGHSGSGKLSSAEWEIIAQFIERIKVETSPFSNQPKEGRQAQWIRPILTVKIHYINWTADRSLRQPVIQSFVKQDPKLCRFEA